MRQKIGGRFDLAVRHHDWPPGEKALFARRNDLRSVQASLRAARGRDVVDEAEVRRLEDLHVEKLEALHAVEREYGFEGGHVTVADEVIAADRQVIQDRIFGASVTALALSLKVAERQAGITNKDGSPKYPGAAGEAQRLRSLIERRLGGT